MAGADVLVELGSGTSDKTRLLLDAMVGAGTLQRFVPFDVSEETLRHAAAEIMAAYEIPVHAIVGDFHRHLGTIPAAGRRLVAFLGSTIGNLDPAQRRRFLFDLDATLDYDDWLLLGTDLVKNRARLVAAYDDAAGVTASFNRNVLGVLDRELGARLRARRVRTRGAVERRGTVDRDAASVDARPDDRDRRPRTEGALRAR